jgi:SWI/SNF-related matrix-associated actin-dependent regulator 1 of chromatin subfamily A
MGNRSEFFAILDKIKKGVTGRFWDGKTNSWKAPPSKKNVEYLKSLGFILTAPVEAVLGKDTGRTFVVPSSTPVSIDVSKLVGFFPYQIEGVRFLETRGGVGIIGDEMGLGKTVQALGYLILHPDELPALVVCPAVAKYVWVDAAMRWMGLPESEIGVLSGRSSCEVDKKSLYVINYDILRDWEGVLKGMGLRVLIGDESQYVSNQKAQRTKALIGIARKVRKRIFLSGTPIKSYPSEFFTVLNLVDPRNFPNHWAYLQRYCDPKYNGFGWEFKGATNQSELRCLIQSVMIRREKSQVLADLPPKLKQVVCLECEPVEYAAYLDADTAFCEWVKTNVSNKKTVEAENRLEGLKQLAYLAKRNSVLRWIEEFLQSGKKLVVFASHLKALDDIQRKFSSICVRIDGSVKAEDRKIIEHRFQNDDSIQLFLGQTTAASVAITLTAASSVAIVEFPRHNADIDQALDRCHRIGQKDTVNGYFLVANGTVENRIIKHFDKNRGVVTNLLDGREVETTDLLENLLEDYLKEGAICES